MTTYFPAFRGEIEMETKIAEMTTEIYGRLKWTQVNLIEIESHYANENKSKFE